ncbi:FAD-dependent oxidoreductase [Aurantivibrio plasticivorans]
MPQTQPVKIELDVAVVGGGIAGLWLTRRLTELGYGCALFEAKALGSDQTLASQGMIHGGIKYTLAGSLTGASESVADMPQYWQDCLKGKGDIDLSNAKTLSEHFYFWSSDSVSSKMTTFFASKSVRGRVDKVDPAHYPTLFQDKQFNGQLYKLQDIVMDTASVIGALSAPMSDRLFLLPTDYRWVKNQNGLAELHFEHADHQYIVCAQQFILCAGKGNGEILNALGIKKPKMQLRPLQQVWVKHSNPYAFYGHCLGADSTPRLTISSHASSDGRIVWSLGGSLAEQGVKQTPAQLIAAAKKELNDLFPWLDFNDAEWSTSKIDRAEAKQRNFMRPDKAFVAPADTVANVMVGWPTKLTLAPNLANEAVRLLDKKSIQQTALSALDPLHALETPTCGVPPWENPENIHA